ncbi:MAG: STY4526/YPO1902 family pathogenicity island replication protein [Candidatus Competibacteraceae bacterium]
MQTQRGRSDNAAKPASKRKPTVDVLRSGFQRADEGDPSVLVNLGFTLPLIREIQNAPLKKRNYFCQLGGIYLCRVLHEELGIVPCQERLEAILLHVEKEDPDDPQHDELLRQGALAGMMRYAFGMTKDEFTVRRILLKVSDTGGRPRQLTYSQEAAILKSWDQSTGLPLTQRFLRVAKESKLDLKRIWPVLRPALGLQETRQRRRVKRSSHVGTATQPPSSVDQRT